MSALRDVSAPSRPNGARCDSSGENSASFNLRRAELHDVQFTDCIIEDLDLMGVVANHLRFVKSQVADLNVQRAKLRDYDLRGATLESIDGLTDLRGATLSPSQHFSMTLWFAEHFLRIED